MIHNNLQLLFIFCLILCSLVLLSRFFFCSSLYSSYITAQKITKYTNNINFSSSFSTNNTVFCDRSSYHSDVCFIPREVRMNSASSSIYIYAHSNNTFDEYIQPHTRKWEQASKKRVSELHIQGINSTLVECDIRHDVPAVFFALPGYSGNLFHAFNNVIIPLYITAKHLNRQVILVILQYRNWWHLKYKDILLQLSDYPPIDFTTDNRIHCFPSAIVGLKFHDTLAIDPTLMPHHETIFDFQLMLEKAYKSNRKAQNSSNYAPKLVLISRNGSRMIDNEQQVVQLAQQIGFTVQVLRPTDTMPLSKIFKFLSSCDVMIGVHGAALTHFLFMKNNSVFIQIVPLGLKNESKYCYLESTKKMGLLYEEYDILYNESSLYFKYGKDNEVIKDPKSVRAKGWDVIKKVYLDDQNVNLDLQRLKKMLNRIFKIVVERRS